MSYYRFPQLLVTNAAVVETAYITSASNTTDLTTYTFSSQSFGAAATDRIVTVTIGARNNVSRTISSVTIGGVSATANVTAINTGSGADVAAIYSAAVPTGTTGDVVVTFSGSMQRCVVGIYRTVGSSGVAASDTDTDLTLTSQALTATIDVPAGGSAIGVCWNASGGTSSVAWTNLTEDYETAPETVSNATSGAHSNFASAQTALAITTTFDAGVARGALAIASWGP